MQKGAGGQPAERASAVSLAAMGMNHVMGLYQQEHGQQAEGSEYSHVFDTFGSLSGVLCLVWGSAEQNGYLQVGKAPTR